jgi:hypothetical protein
MGPGPNAHRQRLRRHGAAEHGGNQPCQGKVLALLHNWLHQILLFVLVPLYNAFQPTLFYKTIT